MHEGGLLDILASHQQIAKVLITFGMPICTWLDPGFNRKHRVPATT